MATFNALSPPIISTGCADTAIFHQEIDAIYSKLGMNKTLRETFFAIRLVPLFLSSQRWGPGN